ncbi:MAG: hypothetical protein ACOY6K_02380 [Pseudomonadota bacterium]
MIVVAPQQPSPVEGAATAGLSHATKGGQIAASRVDKTGDHRMDGAWE